jgi:hypothetical protein
VIASRERAQVQRSPSRFSRWWEDVSVNIENLMKPFALPAAGGFCAAVLLFMTLVPAFSLRHSSVGDVPTGLSTEPALKSIGPIGFQYGDAEVDLRIDEQGRIINYSIMSGQGIGQEALRRSIENKLLFTQFTPATAFGIPIVGTLRLSFRSSRIDVKG